MKPYEQDLTDDDDAWEYLRLGHSKLRRRRDPLVTRMLELRGRKPRGPHGHSALPVEKYREHLRDMLDLHERKGVDPSDNLITEAKRMGVL